MRSLRNALLACGVMVVCSIPATSQNAVSNKRVLLLLTHDSHQAGQVLVEQAMRSTLQAGLPGRIEIYAEYLDAVRSPLEQYEKELVVQLQRKYGSKKFDLIFPLNPPALNLLSRHRSALFPDTPVVFLVLDSRNLEGLNLGPNTTGVWAESNPAPNLELALSLHPGTKHVVVISGVSEWDNYWRTRAQEDFRSYEGKVEFSYFTGLTIPELQSKLAILPQHTIAFFVSSTLDNAGNNNTNQEVLREICSVSNAPVYGTTDVQLGLGIVGGRITSFEAFGGEAARLGLRVLAGEKPESIAAHGVASIPMFDSRVLKRWGISEDRLPAGSIVRFKEPTFWEQYWALVVGVFALIVLQTSFIGLLLLERKRKQRAKEALAQLNAELEQRIAARTAALDNKSRELETFAYSVAHDLKAPLRGIDGYTRLLLEDHLKNLNDEGRSFLDVIHSSTVEMNQLIDDLLEYSRLERREFKPDRFELKPIISTVIEQKKRELTDNNVEFVLNVNGGSVLADANGLTQSLKNYIDNAVKFTHNVSNPRIEVGAKENASNVQVWVQDNGVGFDMKYHDRIFDIFQRLNPVEEFPGTGVGLAIVRKAMQRMGGRAWAKSEPGHGATFFLEIPK